MNRISVPITAICLALLVVVCMTAEAADTAFVIVSSKGNYWKPAAVSEVSSGATVTVNANDKKQKWHGFAGCFNEAGWDALKVLDENLRDSAMKLLFDKNNGIGFPWGRIPIGASDYGINRYTLDESTTDDLTMSKFSIARDTACLIKYIKAAQEIKSNIHFWASPWTPPPWMKENTIAGSNGYDGGDMRNNPQVFDALALYFSKFIEAYTAQGIPISAVCPQNEPGYTRNYPTCGWGKYNSQNDQNVDNPEYLSTFVADHLVPKLQQDHPGTEIWFGTLSNGTTAPGYWNGMKQKLGTNVKNVIKGLGLQWSNKSLVAQNVSDGYFVFCSEHQCGNYYWKSEVSSREEADSTKYLPTMAPNNHAYGEESWRLISEWVNAGAHLYSAWNMVLDTKGFNLNSVKPWPQNAPLAVDRNAKTLEVTPYYYVLRHLSQYVDTGAVRITTQGGDALAFQNPDGSFATIVSNTGASTDMTIAVGGKSYKFNHPGKGWATLYVGPWPPAWNQPVSVAPVKRFSNNGTMLKVTCSNEGYRIRLPSRESGRIELLTLSGRVVESRIVSPGTHEIMLRKKVSPTGLLLVRAINGSTIKTARVMNY